MFLGRSFQIHLHTGNHNHHSCFYTLRTSDRNKFLPRIRQHLRRKKKRICNRNRNKGLLPTACQVNDNRIIYVEIMTEKAFIYAYYTTQFSFFLSHDYPLIITYTAQLGFVCAISLATTARIRSH